MKLKNQMLFILILSMMVVSLACGGVGISAPTPTSVPPTDTPVPTATTKPTSTPRPTATQVPPTPTAVQVGETTADGIYEVTVVYTRKLNTVYLDQIYQWVANPGYLFLEIGVRVKNLQPGSTANVPWTNIYVVEDTGDSWYPGWAAYKAVAGGVNFNPKELVFEELNPNNAANLVTFDEDVYLRLIWTIKDKNPSVVLFGFDTSPLTEITID